MSSTVHIGLEITDGCNNETLAVMLFFRLQNQNAVNVESKSSGSHNCLFWNGISEFHYKFETENVPNLKKTTSFKYLSH